MEQYIIYRFVEVEGGKVSKVDTTEVTGRSLGWDDYIRIAGCQNWQYCGTLPATSTDAPDGFTMLFFRREMRLSDAATENSR